MSQQPRVSIPRHRPGVPTQTPLLNSSTITFFASWRGQLMICGVAILLGGICFILQEPYARFRRRRREAISKAREKELISMESTDKVDAAADDVKEREKKGKEKRKDVKKRKGSLLRVPSAATVSGESSLNPSSIESSPVPSHKPTLPGPKSRSSSCASGRTSTLPTAVSSALSSSPAQPPTGAAPSQGLLEPSPVIHITPSRPSHPLSPEPLDPRDLPLPVSPMAGPSRLSFSNGDNDLESIDGDSGSTSESVSSNNMTGEVPRAKPKPTPPLNFSIIPEEGYLPVQTQTTSTKKKKRKGRTAPPGSLPPSERRSTKTDHPDTPGSSRPVGLDSPTVPVTPSRHARKASLTRPPNADLEALLTERERTIESLRAEIGLAKAEEAKARDLVTRMSVTEERLKGDFERARKASQRSDHESRKREGELNARLSHVSSQFTAALHRINVLESMFRESGQPFPPVSPGLVPGPPGHSPGLAPGHSPGPLSTGHLQPMPSPLPPASPFAMGFGPSPRAVSAGFVPYPSPAMYPSPLLHPHFGHPPNPSAFRRASMTGVDESSLAGPLTPGHPPANGSGIFPFDLGIMPSPSPAQPMPNGNGPLSAADLRRMNIESSVMKKKKDTTKSGSESGEDSNRGLEALPDADETGSIHGLGMGELDVGGSVSMQRGDANGESGSGSSHPSSPSPPTRASMLLTPASADVFRHRALVRGTETPEEFGLRESISDVSEIKMIPDAENGNLYYTTARRADSEAGTGSDGASAYEPREKGENGVDGAEGEGEHVQGCFDEPSEMDVGKEDYVPMFASIAHTPQQVQEIKQMQQKQEKAIRGSRSSSRQGSVVG